RPRAGAAGPDARRAGVVDCKAVPGGRASVVTGERTLSNSRMPFTAATFRFFRGLARNNAKPWFEAHRADYERDVRAPMRALIEEMDVRLARLAPEITGDSKRSMFRIYRDIRFSKDKSPYKTHAACWFRHRDADARVGGDAEGGGAGFYVHIAPGSSFLGAGIWMPPRPILNRLLDAIAQDSTGFERIVRASRFS